MAILETLYILFKGDASDVKKAAGEAKKAGDDAEKSFNKTAKAVGNIKSQISSVITELGGLALGYFSAKGVLSELHEAFDFGSKLSNNARLLNVNVEELNAWQDAAKAAGGTAEGFQASLTNFANSFTGGNVQLAMRIFPLLGESLNKMGRVQGFAYGKRLGLDDGTINLLMRSNEELQALLQHQKDLGVITEADQKMFLEFNKQLTDTNHAFRSFALAIERDILPPLQGALAVIQEFFQYITSHKEYVVAALAAIGAAAAIIAAPFVAANAAVIGLIASVATLAAGMANLYHLAEGLTAKFPKIDLFGFARPGAPGSLGAALGFGGLGAAQGALGLASASNINSLAGTTVNGANVSNRSNSVSVGAVNVHTQATDVDAIVRGATNSLQEHLKQVNSQVDDGRAA